MEKIYKYTSEEEDKINVDLGYTSKYLDHICSQKQYQSTLGISEFKHFIKILRIKKCEKCGSKLILIKECTYVGLRHAPFDNGGDYTRTYEVVYKRYCPKCQIMID